MHQHSTDWVTITEDDFMRAEFRPHEVPKPGPPPRVEDRCVDLFNLFEEESIGGTVYTSLSALIERWGVSGVHALEDIWWAGKTSAVDVKIRWSDRTVRITRLGIGPTWGAFGRGPCPDA